MTKEEKELSMFDNVTLEQLKKDLKRKFIEAGKQWILDSFRSDGNGDSLHYIKSFLYKPENIAEGFCKAMEEQL